MEECELICPDCSNKLWTVNRKKVYCMTCDKTFPKEGLRPFDESKNKYYQYVPSEISTHIPTRLEIDGLPRGLEQILPRAEDEEEPEAIIRMSDEYRRLKKDNGL